MRDQQDNKPDDKPTGDSWGRVDQALRAALEQAPADRKNWVLQKHADDPALRDALLDLLEGDSPAADMLDGVLRERDAIAASAAGGMDLVGSRLGAFRLVELIATGGMGAVYRAERADGEFQQTVAIKILPAWSRDDQTILRLRAERQILSRLQHPNITQLLDGGRSGDGYPYLVTEFIDGRAITEYASRERLDLGQRLELVAEVCDAVHYAHLQGVVHRDIKPSNILVDADGRPHLLDFGIAKLQAEEAMGMTLARTATGFAPMTPEYASPEQLKGEPVAIASDVYQIGLLLYRLLTGARLPTERRQLGATRPSTAVVRSKQAPRWVPQRDPARLARLLRGDLDTLVLKALRDAPEERYATVADLAADIRHHLAGEAIEARAETVFDATRRLARQYPVASGLAASLALLMLISVFSLTFYARALEQQRDLADLQATRASQVKDVLVDVFRRSDPMQQDTLGGQDATVWESLDAAAAEARTTLAGDPEVLAEILALIAPLYDNIGKRDRFLATLEESVELYRELGPEFDAQRAENLSLLISNWAQLDQDKTRQFQAELEPLMARIKTTDPASWIYATTNLASMHRSAGESTESLALYQAALDQLLISSPDNWSARIELLSGVGDMHISLGRHELAESQLREALDLTRTHFAADHSRALMTLSNLSKLARHRGDQAAAIDYGEQVVAIIEDGSPEDYSTLVPAKNNLALAYAAAGRYEESISTMQALIEQRSMIDGPEGSGELGINYKNYATILHTAGRFGEAREAVLTAREYMERHLPGNSPFQATHHFTEALITLDSGDAAAAEAPLLRTLDILEPSLGAEHYQVHVTRCILAEVKRQIGDPLSAQRLAEAALAGMKASGSKTSNYQERCEDTLERLSGAAVANSSAPTSR